MGPAAFQPGQLLLGQIGDGVGQGADAQGNKHLVAVKPGIFVAQAAGLQAADGLKDLGGNEVQLLIDASQSFQGVEQQGGGGSDLVAGLAGDDPAVRQNHGSGGSPGGLLLLQGGGHGGEDGRGDAGVLHQQLQFIDDLLVHGAPEPAGEGGIVPPEDLHMGRLPAGFIVHDAFAHHIDPHIRGGLVGTLAQDGLKNGPQHGEDLHVPVIVYRGDAVGGQVEGIDHIHVVEVGGGGLVGQIHRVVQGQIPHGEGLEFGVTCLTAPAVFMVELAEAGGHFPAAGPGGGDHHQGMAGLDVVVAAIALVADDQFDIVGIPGDGVVAAGPDAQNVQTPEESVRRGLAAVLGHHHAAHIQVHPAKHVDEPQYILLVGDAQVAPDLVLFDISGADGDHDLHILFQLLEHPDLAVRLEAGQNPGGMVVVKELSAKFQVELSAELSDPLPDPGGLGLDVLLIVEPRFQHKHLSLIYTTGSGRPCGTAGNCFSLAVWGLRPGRSPVFTSNPCSFSFYCSSPAGSTGLPELFQLGMRTDPPNFFLQRFQIVKGLRPLAGVP